MTFINHYIDAVVLLVAGIIGLFYYPRKIAKEIEFGKRSQEEGKQWLKKIKLACYFAISLGIFKIIIALLR